MKAFARMLFVVCLLTLAAAAHAIEPIDMARTHRLYQGVTFYIDNAEGKAFDVQLDVRDLNIYANGPREILFKVYDPDGKPVVREYIPDDGVTSKAYLPSIGGWDHEWQYYALCRAHGTEPMISWSAYSDPARLATQLPRTVKRSIAGGKKGIYRLLLVGDRDHYVTVKIAPDLPNGVCGHATFLYGQGDQFNERYFYVPKGSTGLHLAMAQPDKPADRQYSITTLEGKVIYEGSAKGGFAEGRVNFTPGEYDDKVLKLTVSSGEFDYALRVQLTRARKAYTGFGSPALLCKTPSTAYATKGGALYVGDEVFWHPWQIRFEQWMKDNADKADPAVKEQLEIMRPYFRVIGPSDGRDAAGWSNWAYALGYYGFKIWRPAWLLSKNPKTPNDVKAIIDEACIMAADRSSFALDLERVNGNSFAQVPGRLWYAKKITGDKMIDERFEVWIERWRTGGWGEGAGMSKSGTSQEHFGHDANYGSYIIDNWLGKSRGAGQWVEHGILDDTDDPRFQETFDRIMNWMNHVLGLEHDIPTYAFNSRIDGGPNSIFRLLLKLGKAKSLPGDDFTVSVNGGDEFFSARRKNYYVISHHGRIAPEWLTETFYGQIGFSGGVLLQVTVPGKGTVINSSPTSDYGREMHVSNWRNFHIHGIAGVTWDGLPFHGGISEHFDAKLNGNVVTSSGHIRNRNISTQRRYEYKADSIACHVALLEPGDASIRSLWTHGRLYSDVSEAYEMIPFAKAKVTLLDGDGKLVGELSATPTLAKTIVLARDGFGVKVELATAKRVVKGGRDTAMIELVAPGGAKPTHAKDVSLDYVLVPYVGNP